MTELQYLVLIAMGARIGETPAEIARLVSVTVAEVHAIMEELQRMGFDVGRFA